MAFHNSPRPKLAFSPSTRGSPSLGFASHVPALRVATPASPYAVRKSSYFCGDADDDVGECGSLLDALLVRSPDMNRGGSGMSNCSSGTEATITAVTTTHAATPGLHGSPKPRERAAFASPPRPAFARGIDHPRGTKSPKLGAGVGLGISQTVSFSDAASLGLRTDGGSRGPTARFELADPRAGADYASRRRPTPYPGREVRPSRAQVSLTCAGVPRRCRHG